MDWSRMKTIEPLARGLLRIVAALVFIEHGTQKLFGFPAMQMMPTGDGTGAPAMDSGGSLMSTLMTIAGPLELIGGLLLIVGLFSRPVAFILAGETAVIFWYSHVPMGGIFPIINGGEAAVLYCFIFLYIFVAGPGRPSLDELIASRRGTA